MYGATVYPRSSVEYPAPITDVRIVTGDKEICEEVIAAMAMFILNSPKAPTDLQQRGIIERLQYESLSLSQVNYALQLITSQNYFVCVVQDKHNQNPHSGGILGTREFTVEMQDPRISNILSQTQLRWLRSVSGSLAEVTFMAVSQRAMSAMERHQKALESTGYHDSTHRTYTATTRLIASQEPNEGGCCSVQ